MNHRGTRKLETTRLVLRRFTLLDAPAMYRNWASDAEVTRYLTWPPHGSVTDSEAVLREWVSSYAHDTFYQWAIVCKEGADEPMGSISAVFVNDDLEIIHIGYCLGRAFWHQGYMSEALGALIDFFFAEVGANRVESIHDVDNPRSGMVMRRCGMLYEGTLRQSCRNNQGIRDACHYAILRRDWHMR